MSYTPNDTSQAGGGARKRNPVVNFVTSGTRAVASTIGAVALAATAVVGLCATCFLMFAAFFSMMAYTPLGIIVLSAMTIGAAFGTRLALDGADRMWGKARGAFDRATSLPTRRKPFVPPAPAQVQAPSMPVSVPKYAGVPPQDYFNASAAPFAAIEAGAGLQQRRNAPGPR